MEWKQEEPNWYIAKCADLMLDVELMETGDDPEPWLWTANLNRAESEGAIEFQSGWAASGDAAKLAAESFARTWVAAQAAALGDGWVPVEERLPEELTRVVMCIVLVDVPGIQNLAIGTYGLFRGWNIEGWNDGHPPSYRVTHWRPLPPLPAAEVKG